MIAVIRRFIRKLRTHAFDDRAGLVFDERPIVLDPVDHNRTDLNRISVPFQYGRQANVVRHVANFSSEERGRQSAGSKIQRNMHQASGWASALRVSSGKHGGLTEAPAFVSPPCKFR